MQLLSLQDTNLEVKDKLLNGWKMLKELCPISEFPLLEKNRMKWSPRLQMEVQIENNNTISCT